MENAREKIRKIMEVRERLQDDLLNYLEKAPTIHTIASVWSAWSGDTICDIVDRNLKDLLPPAEENS